MFRINYKRLRESFADDQVDAVRAILRGDKDPEDYPGVDAWVRQCYGRPSDEELMMAAVNEALGLHGVEAIRGEWVDNFHGDCIATFANTGDTYADTVFWDCAEQRFMVSSVGAWGDRAK
ncbi:MAG: hypothetical protein GY720_15790 [bacterium]|nr:hypothetical protein [bacterium]